MPQGRLRVMDRPGPTGAERPPVTGCNPDHAPCNGGPGRGERDRSQGSRELPPPPRWPLGPSPAGPEGLKAWPPSPTFLSAGDRVQTAGGPQTESWAQLPLCPVAMAGLGRSHPGSPQAGGPAVSVLGSEVPTVLPPALFSPPLKTRMRRPDPWNESPLETVLSGWARGHHPGVLARPPPQPLGRS